MHKFEAYYIDNLVGKERCTHDSSILAFFFFFYVSVNNITVPPMFQGINKLTLRDLQ